MNQLRTVSPAGAQSPLTYRLRVWEYLVRAWRPYFWSGLGESFVTPVIYLLAMGLGLGALVDAKSDALGMTYIQYIAPALLMGAALQLAMAESTFFTFGRFKWTRVLWGITATPVTPAVAADGHLMFIGTRIMATATMYYLVLLAFGVAGGPTGLLMIPIAALCGLSCAVWALVLSAVVEDDGPTVFNLVFRFVVLPMALFSASFFPISQLPWAVRWLAFISPLWHGNELARASVVGGLADPAMAVHLLVLVGLLAAGIPVVHRRFARRLVV